MIVLKILLWILLAVLGIIVLILLLPVRGAVSYIDNKLTYSAHYSFILLYNSDKKGVVAWYLKWKKKRDEKKKAKEDAENAQSYAEEPIVPEPPTGSKPPPEEKPPEPEKPPLERDTKPEATAETPDFDEIDEPFEEEDNGKKKKKKKLPPSTIMEKIEFVLNIVRASDRALLRIFKGVKIYGLYIDFIIANEDAYKCALNYGRISGALYNVLGWLSVLFSVKLKTVDVNPGFAVDKPRWDAAAKIKFRPMTAVIAGVGLLLTYIFRFFIPGFFRERKLRKSAARQK
jgi:hypothetical protein